MLLISIMLTLFLPVVDESTFPDRETNWKFKFIVGKIANSKTTLFVAGLGYNVTILLSGVVPKLSIAVTTNLKLSLTFIQPFRSVIRSLKSPVFNGLCVDAVAPEIGAPFNNH